MLVVCWWLHLKMQAVSAFEGVLQLLWPLFFATIAFLMFRVSGDPEAMVYAGIGASVMGIWSTIATTASSALQRERSMGTLEHLVSSPTPLALSLLPITAAMATLGLYSMAATLLWGWVVFDIPLRIADPGAFALSVVLVILSVSLVGFLLSVAAVRYRTAWALGNMLEYPGWLVCGFLIPVKLLPAWVAPLAFALPPTWGMEAIRQAAAGEDPWAALAICLALAAVFGLVGTLLSERLLRSARRHGSLSLT